MEVVSPSLKKLWNEWQLRALVLLSLTLQIILIILGNRRKYINKFWIKMVVWPSYLSADSVATAALGVLASKLFANSGSLSANMELSAFWAPFLLLHLGGPDTITAYSMEDNELWSRHLLQLIVQTGFALYIFFMAWTGSHLSILTIPMMFAGFIKYGERTWVLWSASYEQRRASLSDGPGIVNIAHHEQVSISNRSDTVNNIDHEHAFFFNPEIERIDSYAGGSSTCEEGSLLASAYGLLEVTKCFFIDAPVSGRQLEASQAVLSKMSSTNAFKVIEKELGFMYDMIYTKEMVTHTPMGIALRFISFLLTCIVLVFFTFTYQKQKDSKVDLHITFVLLTVAIFLEIFAAFVLLSSDQTIVWLRKCDRTKNIAKAIISLPLLRNPTWSNTMGQYNLLSYSLKEKPLMGCRKFLLSYLPKGCQKILNLLNIDEKQQYADYQPVPDHVKRLIFKYFSQELFSSFMKAWDVQRDLRFELVFGKGSWQLSKRYADSKEFCDQILIPMEFEQNILVWHIATEFCYHLDHVGGPNFPFEESGTREIFGLDETRRDFKHWMVQNQKNNILDHRDCSIPEKETAVTISRYMMYLLTMSPEVIPPGGVYRDINLVKTCEQLGKTFEKTFEEVEHHGWDASETKILVCNELLGQFRETSLSKLKTTTGESLLPHACKILEFFYKEGVQHAPERRWETIWWAWMELLIYALVHCRGRQHAQQLREGGEFLTHVLLLLSHFKHMAPSDVWL